MIRLAEKSSFATAANNYSKEQKIGSTNVIKSFHVQFQIFACVVMVLTFETEDKTSV